MCFRHYRCEIAAFDIQTKRCDVYGQEDQYGSRCLLMYDGLHYDALVVAAFPDAPEETDCTVFDPATPDAEQVCFCILWKLLYSHRSPFPRCCTGLCMSPKA